MKFSKSLLHLVLIILFVSLSSAGHAQKSDKAVLAYFSGDPKNLDSFDVKKMTHIIYCFGHLDGNKLKLGRQRDTIAIQKMVALKQVNPALKVLISLGGWGGCKTCSDVFNSRKGRRDFAKSVKELTDYFNSDGIDLDWEYPSVNGYPGHTFRPEDKDNFTGLIKKLRQKLGKDQTITFAAGGFQDYIDSAVDWKKVTPLVNYINLMTYDLVGGYATTTGHHTPLFSANPKAESVDKCVRSLMQLGVGPAKLIVGAAFYARVFAGVSPVNKGLYQAGVFKHGVDFRRFEENLSAANGYELLWDDVAKAPYAYNATDSLFATFDDKRSIKLKTQYVIDNNLGGIMFWELVLDKPTEGLLDVINNTLKKED